MDDALWQLVFAIKDLIVPALAVGITAALRAGAPRLKDAVPAPLWPFVALLFARIGTRVCYAIDAPCEGNFVNWSDPEAYALAQGLAVVAIHRTAKWLKEDVTPAVQAKLQNVSATTAAPLIALALLTATMLAPTRVEARLTWQRFDCDTSQGPVHLLADYVAANGPLLEALGTLALGFLDTSPSANGAVKLQANVNYVGVGAQALSSFVELGVSPLGFFNLVAHALTCHGFVDVPDIGAPAAAAGGQP